ncbi:MAG: hypothetical protein RL272_1181 [Candidatus Parcubacteria bacterium]
MSYMRDRAARVVVPCRDLRNGERIIEDRVIELHYGQVGLKGRVRWWGREAGRLGWQSENTLRRTILKAALWPLTSRPAWMTAVVADVDRQLKMPATTQEGEAESMQNPTAGGSDVPSIKQ